MSPTRHLFLPALAGLVGTLLSGCSSADSAPETAAAEKPEATAVASAAQFPFGAKVDSLNGIAGHSFGQPVSAFPRMRSVEAPSGELTKVYSDEGSPGKPGAGWFGKHRRAVPTQLYWFLNDQFSQFRAVGDAPTLRAEAIYLLGPGQAQGKYQLFWEGRRARAVYVEKPQGFGWQGTLDVLSKPLEAELAAQQQAWLKAENAE